MLVISGLPAMIGLQWTEPDDISVARMVSCNPAQRA
jgi:hypothetical protein